MCVWCAGAGVGVGVVCVPVDEGSERGRGLPHTRVALSKWERVDDGEPLKSTDTDSR